MNLLLAPNQNKQISGILYFSLYYLYSDLQHLTDFISYLISILPLKKQLHEKQQQQKNKTKATTIRIKHFAEISWYGFFVIC